MDAAFTNEAGAHNNWWAYTLGDGTATAPPDRHEA